MSAHRFIVTGLATASVALAAIPWGGAAGAHQADRNPVDSVSIVVNEQEPELGQKLVVHGRVDPNPGRTGHRFVTLQVRYEGQKRWKSLRRSRVSPDGRYQLRARARSVRDRSYRVTTSDSAGRVFATSEVEKVNVLTWRNLTSLTPVSSNGLAEVASVTVSGTAYVDSITATGNAGGRLTIDYDLLGYCKRLTSGTTSEPWSGVNALFAEADGIITARMPPGGGNIRGPLRHGVHVSLVASVVSGSIPSFLTPRVLCDPDGHLT